MFYTKPVYFSSHFYQKVALYHAFCRQTILYLFIYLTIYSSIYLFIHMTRAALQTTLGQPFFFFFFNGHNKSAFIHGFIHTEKAFSLSPLTLLSDLYSYYCFIIQICFWSKQFEEFYLEYYLYSFCC